MAWQVGVKQQDGKTFRMLWENMCCNQKIKYAFLYVFYVWSILWSSDFLATSSSYKFSSSVLMKPIKRLYKKHNPYCLAYWHNKIIPAAGFSLLWSPAHGLASGSKTARWCKTLGMLQKKVFGSRKIKYVLHMFFIWSMRSSRDCSAAASSWLVLQLSSDIMLLTFLL